MSDESDKDPKPGTLAYASEEKNRCIEFAKEAESDSLTCLEAGNFVGALVHHMNAQTVALGVLLWKIEIHRMAAKRLREG